MKALDLLQNKNAHDDGIYFQIYPNNIPITLIRYGLYLIAPVYSREMLFILDHLVCMVALNIGIYYSWKIVLMQLGRKMTVLFLVIVLSCLPIFFYSLYFYSDTLMIMMPPLLIYLWLRYERDKRLIDIIMLCLLLAVGCVIRQNLILFLPALTLYLLLKSNVKKAVFIVIGTLAALFIWQASTSQLAQQVHINANQQLKMPTTHWIMLGLSEQGRYNWQDFRRSYNQHTQAKKKEVNMQEIKRRLTRKKSELLYLWLVKAFRVYVDGSMGYYWYMGNTSEHTLMYDYFFGGQRRLIQFISQIFHCVNLWLLLCSVLRFFRLHKIDANLLIQIMLFGNYLFYIFVWEAEPRYALLFIFPMLIGNCYGIKELVSYSNENQFALMYLKTRVNAQSLAHILFSILLCITVAHLAPLTQKPDVQYRYAVNQNQRKGTMNAHVSATSTVQQTFYADQPFDYISLGKVSAHGHGAYELVIHSLSGTLEEERIAFSDQVLEQGKLSDIKLDRKLSGDKNYQLSVSMISEGSKDFLNLAIHGKGLFEQRDLYQGGTLFQNGRMNEGKDLQFRIYRRETRPYLNRAIYFLLMSIPLVAILIFADTYRKPLVSSTAHLHTDTDPV
ncbi:glycosyltransferase family 39 protein [Sporolactobacillus sp. STCC-11]|uniref:glycosyltransferase family 39 protein n=1 Tax=Sporolactobacillus caesalpiniae TaxID=3230362 RepID=UPI0033974716